jgi:hypothetical protein
VLKFSQCLIFSYYIYTLDFCQDILLEATDIETQLLDKVLMYVRGMGEPNSLKEWVVMRLQVDGYEASLCKTSWVSSFGHKGTFLCSN